MSNVQIELLEAIDKCIESSRVLPKEGSALEMLRLLLNSIKEMLIEMCKDLVSIITAKKSKHRRKESMLRLISIVNYRMFDKENLEKFDCQIKIIKNKYPDDIYSTVLGLNDSTGKYLKYPRRGELLEAYLPILSVSLITLIFVMVYGGDFIFEKIGSFSLGLAIALFTCKIKFGLAYDLAVAKLTNFLLERIEDKIQDFSEPIDLIYQLKMPLDHTKCSDLQY